MLEPVTALVIDEEPRVRERRAPLDTETVPWGVARVGGPGARSAHTLWVLDSGVDPTHRDLVVDVARSYDAVLALRDDGDADMTHGTAVAGIAAALANDRDVVGVAPGTRVASVRVLDANERGAIDVLVSGLDHVARRAETGDVANLSMAVRTGPSAVLEHAIRRVADRIPIVVAAGNQHRTITGIAAIEHRNVYTVSAIGEDDCLAAISNFGPGVDVAAPGRNILSLAPGNATAVYDGTSVAAPHVAGLLLGGVPVGDGVPCGDPDGRSEPIAHR
jgi:subtilisin family serine protease